MYVNVPVQLYIEDTKVTFMATEVFYVPVQRQTFNCEGLPATVEVVAGYVFETESGKELKKWKKLYEDNMEKVDAAVLKDILGDSYEG